MFIKYSYTFSVRYISNFARRYLGGLNWRTHLRQSVANSAAGVINPILMRLQHIPLRQRKIAQRAVSLPIRPIFRIAESSAIIIHIHNHGSIGRMNFP